MQFLHSANKGEAVKACKRVVDKILETLLTDSREALNLNNTLIVLGPWNALAILKAVKALKALKTAKVLKALEALTTPIDPETKKVIVKFILLFWIFKRQGTPPPDGSPDPFYRESPASKGAETVLVKHQNLLLAAIE